MNHNIEVIPATEEYLLKLLEQDRSYSTNKMFSVTQMDTDGSFTISEVELPEPLVSTNDLYTGPSESIGQLSDPNYMVYVARLNGETVGYCNAHWKIKPYGKKIIIDGVFSSKHMRGKGIASLLIQKFIEIGKSDEECLGVHVEMDTTKYHAIKMLLKNGFMPAGIELYVWHSEAPSKFSKEVLYYYYSIRPRQ